MDLTENSLEKLLEELSKLTSARGELLTLRPTEVTYKIADLEALGVTHEDVVKMIESQHG
jgi:hypothetical protein